MNKFQLNSKTNHSIMLLLLVAQGVLIVYNHIVTQGWTAIRVDEFAQLSPLAAAYWTSIKAQQSDSSKWITAKQAIAVLTLAEIRRIDPHQYAKAFFGVSLDALTGEQAELMRERLEQERTSDA